MPGIGNNKINTSNRLTKQNETVVCYRIYIPEPALSNPAYMSKEPSSLFLRGEAGEKKNQRLVKTDSVYLVKFFHFYSEGPEKEYQSRAKKENCLEAFVCPYKHTHLST